MCHCHHEQEPLKSRGANFGRVDTCRGTSKSHSVEIHHTFENSEHWMRSQAQMPQINEAAQFTIAQHVKCMGKDASYMEIGILRLNHRTANMVHCKLPNMPKAPSSACFCWCSNFDGTGSISTNTDPFLVALPPVLQLQERSESSNKEFRSHTYICPERRSKQFLLTYNAAFRVTASVSFSLTCVEI